MVVHREGSGVKGLVMMETMGELELELEWSEVEWSGVR